MIYLKQIIIEGGNKLSGTIKIGGAKNSAVALIPASILASGKSVINNVPCISDCDDLMDILNLLNVHVDSVDGRMEIDATNVENKSI